MITNFVNEVTYPDPVGKTRVVELLRLYRRRLPPAAQVLREPFVALLQEAGFILARDGSNCAVLCGRTMRGHKQLVLEDGRVRISRQAV